MRNITLVLMLAVSLSAEDKKSDNKPPIISAELKAKFWKAVTEANVAQTVLESKQLKLKMIQDEIIKVCGSKAEAKLDGTDEGISCKEKPAPPEKKEK